MTGASGEASKQLRLFRTVTSPLQELDQGLAQEGCCHVKQTNKRWSPIEWCPNKRSAHQRMRTVTCPVFSLRQPVSSPSGIWSL